MNDLNDKLIEAFGILKDEKTKFTVCPTCGQETMRLIVTRADADPDLIIGKDLLCDNCGEIGTFRVAPERVPPKKDSG